MLEVTAVVASQDCGAAEVKQLHVLDESYFNPLCLGHYRVVFEVNEMEARTRRESSHRPLRHAGYTANCRPAESSAVCGYSRVMYEALCLFLLNHHNLSVDIFITSSLAGTELLSYLDLKPFHLLPGIERVISSH